MTDERPAVERRGTGAEICAGCGYSMAALEARAACPECGGTSRVRLEAVPFVDARSVERVLWFQGAGAAACLVAGLFGRANIIPCAVLLAILGVVLCVIVGPALAMTRVYAGSRLARQPRALRPPGAVLLFVVVSGCAAFCTGAIMAFGACLAISG